MERQEALTLLKKHLKNKNLIKHCLAVEAIMREIAVQYNDDVEKFGLAGLLHDIDYDSTFENLEIHSQVGSEILKESGLSDDIVYAVKVHNEVHGLPRITLMDKALYAADPVSGFVIAGALIRPEKSLFAIDVDFLVNRYKEKGFARGANRETMATCVDFGMSLEEFLALSLKACQGIHKELGL
ncbi:MAG: HD domain-containing protein [Candidatus Saccharibacteria bacterium]